MRTKDTKHTIEIDITSKSLKDLNSGLLRKDRKYRDNLEGAFIQICNENNRYVLTKPKYVFSQERIKNEIISIIDNIGGFNFISTDVFLIKKENTVGIDIKIDRNYFIKYRWYTQDCGEEIRPVMWSGYKNSIEKNSNVTKNELKMCKNKKTFETSNEALQACIKFRSNRFGFARVYECPYCKKYHLTTQHLNGRK